MIKYGSFFIFIFLQIYVLQDPDSQMYIRAEWKMTFLEFLFAGLTKLAQGPKNQVPIKRKWKK